MFLRDAVACLMMTIAANVCASVTWQHYFAAPATITPDQPKRLRIYSASPAIEAPLLPTRMLPTACIGESHPGEYSELELPMKALAPSPVSERMRSCPDAMRLVEGMHCPIVGHLCRDWLSVERDRCKEYVAQSPCVGIPSSLRFCIDEFEYPNRLGSKPMVGVNYLQATELCRLQNKRLCSSTEWELACEGPLRLPYPTGYVRDATLCNFDRPNIDSNNDAYARAETREAEIARLDQREASGSRPSCVSAYGVYDMTGNVDEWVLNEEGSYNKPPHRSALKGGYWGRVRNRCRPMTTDHNEWHSGYQVGFRCCAEASGPAAPVNG